MGGAFLISRALVPDRNADHGFCLASNRSIKKRLAELEGRSRDLAADSSEGKSRSTLHL